MMYILLGGFEVDPNLSSRHVWIMWEPIIMQESVSGRSWTSKVFNAVINLDTYQFLN
jgi:hypothetical protein